MTMETLTITLPADLKKWVADRAKIEDRSESAVARQAIRAYRERATWTKDDFDRAEVFARAILSGE